MDEPMSRVTHDLLAEILSRVPYKSLCICKCVCPAWRDIIADPVHRKRFAQSLVGFFYQHRAVDESTAGSADPCGGFSVARGVSCVDLSAFSWASVPRTRPRLLLPPDTDSMDFSLEDSCDGLFLTRIPTGTHEARTRYVVSNPATVMGEVLCCIDKCNLHKNSNGDIVLFLENANFSVQFDLCPFSYIYCL
ncbi:hypothetical protein ACQ4PT_040268 [Festuca glaucescens]